MGIIEFFRDFPCKIMYGLDFGVCYIEEEALTLFALFYVYRSIVVHAQ